jgi:hypothetical protein
MDGRKLVEPFLGLSGPQFFVPCSMIYLISETQGLEEPSPGGGRLPIALVRASA